MSQVKVLLVDDDQDDLELISDALSEAGLVNQVLTFSDPESAYSYLKSNYSEQGRARDLPDLMLVDLNMPKINGLQLLQKLKQVGELSNSRIMILTTSDNPTDKAAAFSAGADGYLVKPSSYSALVCLMKSTIEKQQGSHSCVSGGANV